MYDGEREIPEPPPEPTPPEESPFPEPDLDQIRKGDEESNERS